ncbi:unnamed protein product [Allacma fusca]|uniref:Cytochrome b5 heme-binding domain-containing protein n=1 Tax=Allacma fusca TaxID=39272 RepID=A0A8J2KKS7_9HEXA|nr:unnamed protein product [Allacma fusca]
MAPNQGSSSGLSPKNPSSFPGIYKYPADRNLPFKNGYQWLAGKRKDDDIGKLWRVYDKLYNLESFAHKHPGGDYWIRLTQGTDITEAFEASHVAHVKKVEEILAKYYVRDVEFPRNSPYTFKQDGFYMTLKRRAGPILEEVGTNSTLQIRLMIDGLGLAYVLLSFFGVFLNSTLLQILAGLDLAMLIIAAHNFFHMRDNWRKFYYDFSLQSSIELQISHAISHHLYTNTVMDIEISNLEPAFEFLPKEKTFLKRYAPGVYAHLFYIVSFFLDLIKRGRAIANGTQQLRPENLIVFIQLAVWMLIAPSVPTGIYSWLFIHAVASYWFMLVAVGGSAHHHPSCFHDGDEARNEADFGLCQLDAIRDRSDDLHQTLFVILTTFGAHSLHHLFPTVCHSKLHHLQEVYEQTLKEFNEEFHPVSQFELFLGMHKQLARVEALPHPAEIKKQK